MIFICFSSLLITPLFDSLESESLPYFAFKPVDNVVLNSPGSE